MTWTAPPERVLLDIEMPKPQPFVLDPAKTAVVIVDMENFFVHNPRFPRSFDTVEGNARLIAKAREAGAPVIYIQSVRKPTALEVVRFGGEPMLAEGSEGVEIVPELAPLPGEAVAQKWSHDPWAWPDLDAVLVEKGIVPEDWTVLVTGVSAAVCAHATALGFSNRHFMTIIPMDATAAGSVEEEARVYAQYAGPGYTHNMAFTLSDLVTFEFGAIPAEQQMASLATA